MTYLALSTESDPSAMPFFYNDKDDLKTSIKTFLKRVSGRVFVHIPFTSNENKSFLAVMCDPYVTKYQAFEAIKSDTTYRVRVEKGLTPNDLEQIDTIGQVDGIIGG